MNQVILCRSRDMITSIILKYQNFVSWYFIKFFIFHYQGIYESYKDMGSSCSLFDENVMNPSIISVNILTLNFFLLVLVALVSTGPY